MIGRNDDCRVYKASDHGRRPLGTLPGKCMTDEGASPLAIEFIHKVGKWGTEGKKKKTCICKRCHDPLRAVYPTELDSTESRIGMGKVTKVRSEIIGTIYRPFRCHLCE